MTEKPFFRGNIISVKALFGDIPSEKLEQLCALLIPEIEKKCKANIHKVFELMGNVKYGKIVSNTTGKKGRIVMLDILFKHTTEKILKEICEEIEPMIINICLTHCNGFLKLTPFDIEISE